MSSTRIPMGMLEDDLRSEMKWKIENRYADNKYRMFLRYSFVELWCHTFMRVEPSESVKRCRRHPASINTC